MAQFDMPLDDLRRYRPELPEPADLDEFWERTLAESRDRALDTRVTPAASPLKVVESFDVTFSGFGGTPIKAWLHLPMIREGSLPVVVEFIGYGGGRGLVHQRNLFAQAGFAHFVMDSRGMGFGGLVSDSPDEYLNRAVGHAPGLLTSGILSPESHYLRRLYTDAVLAVEAAARLPQVDASRIAVAGTSLGGGVSIAVSGLSEHVTATIADVPFLCDFPRAIRLTDRDPYHEVVQFLHRNRLRVDDAELTLSYFDAAILARRAQAPALFSVALMDEVCPPSTVYAAFNLHGVEQKEIVEWGFNGHEGGQEHQEVRHFTWLADQFEGTRS